MTTDELRAKFEALLKMNGPIAMDRGLNDGSYSPPGMQSMWIGFKGGYASRDAEVESLRKDAERYRLLRSCSGYQAPFCVTQNIGHDWIIVRRDELDQAIDAAMREESK